jgi:diguanylate cyclase (GGDEF)-like protein
MMAESLSLTSILVVDDLADTLEVVRIPLEADGYRVQTARNGLEAWKAMEATRFDLLITDLMMPVMDGLELCRRVKNDPEKRGIYIIILSAKGETEEKILGLETGADDYLEKPFALAELLARVKAGERIIVTQKALEQKQKLLEEIARRDSLTGLYNRRHFEEALELEHLRTLRYRHPVSVAMADVDHFKEINDVHGHAGGDLVLKDVAQVLVTLTRQTDTVARYGGDEFAIIFPETSAKSARVVGDKIQKAMEAHRIQLGDAALVVTLSLGLTSTDASPQSWRTIIEEADKALYEAKAQGRNRIVAR